MTTLQTSQSLSTRLPFSHLRRRALAALIALAALTPLILAATLHPAGRSVGTHTQLGLPPCSLLATTSYPCPSCGMTTAFAYASHGRLLTAFTTQPLGAALALASAMTAVAAFYITATAMSPAPIIRPFLSRYTPLLILAAILLAWTYKTLALRGAIS